MSPNCHYKIFSVNKANSKHKRCPIDFTLFQRLSDQTADSSPIPSKHKSVPGSSSVHSDGVHSQHLCRILHCMPIIRPHSSAKLAFASTMPTIRALYRVENEVMDLPTYFSIIATKCLWPAGVGKPAWTFARRFLSGLFDGAACLKWWRNNFGPSLNQSFTTMFSSEKSFSNSFQCFRSNDFITFSHSSKFKNRAWSLSSPLVVSLGEMAC